MTDRAAINCRVSTDRQERKTSPCLAVFDRVSDSIKTADYVSVNHRGARGMRQSFRAIAIGLVSSVLVTACTVSATDNQPAPLRELAVIAEPREAAEFLLNPNPIGAGGYSAGMLVTIDVLPKKGWEVEEWIGPVYGITGKTARIEMNSSLTVIVKLIQVNEPAVSDVVPAQVKANQLEPTVAPTAPPTATARVIMVTATPSPTIPPTDTPPPTLTPRPTATPRPTPTRTPRPTSTRKPTATPWPTNTPEPTVAITWRTYRNPKHGYVIDVPPLWAIDDEDKNAVYLSPNNFGGLTIFNPSPVGFKETISQNTDHTLNFRANETNVLFELVSRTETTVSNGFVVVMFEFRRQGGPAYCVERFKTMLLFVNQAGTRIRYELLGSVCEGHESNMSDITQIQNTFAARLNESLR